MPIIRKRAKDTLSGVPIRKGQQFDSGAGVLSGAVDHSHFVFKIHDEGETVLLDPWILFSQMYRDQRR